MTSHRLKWGTLPVRVIKFRRLRRARHVVRMEESKSALKILKGQPTGKRPSGRPWRRWEDNIRMDLKEIGYVSMPEICLIWLRIGIIGEPL